MIRLGVHGWEVHPGTACADCEPYPGMRDRLWARIFLQRMAKDPLAVMAIRHVLWSGAHPWTLTKVATVDQIGLMAELLSRGLWHVHAPPVPDDQGGGESEVEEEDIADIEQGPAARNDAAPRPDVLVEEASLPRNADEAAIASSMKLASEMGIPFCEECAKAAMQRARGAAVA